MGGLLRVVFHLRLAEVLHGVLVNLLVHFEYFLGQQDGEIGLLDGAYRAQAALTGLFHGQFHLVGRQGDAFPQLGVHQGHGSVDTGTPGVESAHGDATGIIRRFLGRFGDIGLDGAGMLSYQLVQVPFNGFQDAGEHAGRAAALAVVAPTHIHHLLLDGSLIRSCTVHLRKQSGISAFAGIFLSLDFHVGHLYGGVLRKGYFDSIVQREHQDGISLGGTFRPLVLRPGQGGNQQRQQKD